LGEYLAAGPELIRRFDNARDIDVNPVGAAVVRAAVDWRRVGLTRPIPTTALRNLCSLYLDTYEARRLDDEAFTRALTWATKRVVATSALLVETGGGYRAFDYLLDYVEQVARLLLPVGFLRQLGPLVSLDDLRRVELALRATYRRTGQSAILDAASDFAHIQGGVHVSDSTIGMVGDSVIQHGHYVAGRDIHIVAPPPGPPHQLPPDIADFTGRERIVESVREALEVQRTVGPRVLLFSGMPGVGKSATAIHLAHMWADSFPDGQLYVNLRGPDLQPLSPELVLDQFLRALGIAPDVQPSSLDEMVARFRTLLVNRRVLILLDNAGDEAQVRPLLPGSSTCTVIVTSRRRLAVLDGDFIHFDVLQLGEAEVLLERLVGSGRVQAEREAARELVLLCGYLPLAIRIAGAVLRERPSWTLTAYVARLHDQHGRLDQLEVGDLSVRTTFENSYRMLPQETARAFRFLGLLDTPVTTPQALAALLDSSPDEAGGWLEALVVAELVTPYGPEGTVVVHDLIRLFARELLNEEEPPNVQYVALQRLQAIQSTKPEKRQY
jgi:hypothetical protein